MAVDEEAITTDGVKLSMFDISDPTDVQEMTIYVIENTYGTDVASNYKAPLWIQKRICSGSRPGPKIKTHIISLHLMRQKAFIRYLKESFPTGGDRGLYAGDRFYLICGSSVESYTLDGFEKIDDLVL